jgi:hypothetical protein
MRIASKDTIINFLTSSDASLGNGCIHVLCLCKLIYELVWVGVLMEAFYVKASTLTQKTK